MTDQLFFLNPQRQTPSLDDMPLFIFLPGMDGTGELLYLQTEDLQHLFDLRCLVIPASDMSNWDQLADGVAALIEEELAEQPRPVYLCGESFGGCLAQKVAARSPHLIDRLILVNPASSFQQRPILVWGSQFTQYVPDILYRSSCAGLLPFLAHLKQLDAHEREELLRAMRSVSRVGAAWRLSLLRDFAISNAQMQRLNMPVLVVAGVRDNLLPSLDEAERLVKVLPNAQMHLLFESGHTCLLERDINFADILKTTAFAPAVDQSNASAKAASMSA